MWLALVKLVGGANIVLFQPAPEHLRRQVNVTVQNASRNPGLLLRSRLHTTPDFFRPLGEIIEDDTNKKLEEGLLEQELLHREIMAWGDAPYEEAKTATRNDARKASALYRRRFVT